LGPSHPFLPKWGNGTWERLSTRVPPSNCRISVTNYDKYHLLLPHTTPTNSLLTQETAMWGPYPDTITHISFHDRPGGKQSKAHLTDRPSKRAKAPLPTRDEGRVYTAQRSPLPAKSTRTEHRNFKSTTQTGQQTSQPNSDHSLATLNTPGFHNTTFCTHNLCPNPDTHNGTESLKDTTLSHVGTHIPSKQ